MGIKKSVFTVLLGLACYCFMAQIPILNSNPSATGKVIYLDFDGEIVTGTLWNSSFSTPTITAVPSTISLASKINVWKRVSEDFIPFNVNVTTDETRFINAPAGNRQRVVITPSSSWYPTSVGGVAYVGSFTFFSDTPVWAFENQLTYNSKYIAEACSHEVGHSLTLRHQSTFNAACAKTNEYNPGSGTGVTSWVPIMGNGYSKNVSVWHLGTNTYGCSVIQSDYSANTPGINGPGRLNFKTDDIGNNYANAKELFINNALIQDSGLISEPLDIDAFKFTICNSRKLTFNIKPWALDTVNYNGANLDIKFQLYSAASSSLIIDAPLSKLSSLTSIALIPGSYYFTIDGDGSPNYSDYGSLGRYYLSIYSTNIPLVTPSFTLNPSVCEGNIYLTDQSSGLPNTWLWSVSGPLTFTSSSQNPTFSLTTAGLYTVSLMANNSSSLIGCAKTETVMVNPSPAITVNSGSICLGNTFTISPSGANIYTIQGGSTIVSPVINTTFTVTGSNTFGCTSISPVVCTITVVPIPLLNIMSSNIISCSGSPVTLTASGASSYSWSTTQVSPIIVVSPLVTTNYTVMGSNLDGCISTLMVTQNVSSCVGIENIANEQQSIFTIYPNPNDGIFYIQIYDMPCQAYITNILNQQIFSSNLSMGKQIIDISNQGNGIYFLKTITKGKSQSIKIIKNE